MVDGSLDADGTQELEQAVAGVLDQEPKHIVFDFSELDYINSSGLRVLVMAYQKLKKNDGVVAICGIKDYIKEVFEISGFDRVFRMHAGRKDALDEL